jgi:hypothetical protein
MPVRDVVGMAMSDRQNFQSWYVDVLNALYPTRSAGMAVFMVSLPLAERYLRQKNGLGPDANLSDDVMKDLVRIFPGLRNVAEARQFWGIYRNGFLHQATLSRTTRNGTELPSGSLTHDTAEAVQIRPDGCFCVHPVLFSQTIVREIEADFTIFAGVTAGAPPLPSVVRLDPVSIPSTYIGTSNSPQSVR